MSPGYPGVTPGAVDGLVGVGGGREGSPSTQLWSGCRDGREGMLWGMCHRLACGVMLSVGLGTNSLGTDLSWELKMKG